jgi:N-acetylneuraminate synthase/sialic acid synthase
MNMANEHKDLKGTITIDRTLAGNGQPVYFIAEIGNNHNGDFFLAKKSIEEAVKSGANAVKFQKRFIDEVFTKELKDQPQTKDQIYGTTYGEYRTNLELSEEDLVKLKKVADDLGVTFFVTPFDKKSVDLLERIGVTLYKIASFDMTNIPLLEYVAKKGKPVILSVGMATMEEVDLAVATVLKHNKQLMLMHCISVYPTPDEQLNLATIPFLKERYAPIPVGYSGHERDILPSLASVMVGATCIERHFTLDKKLPGPDHATVSLEPEEFKNMVDGTRRLEKSIGVSGKNLLEDEKKARDKHSKSIVSIGNIAAGATITINLITYKSPGYGFKPYMVDKLLGRKVLKDIPEDTVITVDHVGEL